MYTCAHCTVKACRQEHPDQLPQNCPMGLHPDVMDTPQPEYFLPENHEFYVKCSEIEAEGYTIEDIPESDDDDFGFMSDDDYSEEDE